MFDKARALEEVFDVVRQAADFAVIHQGKVKSHLKSDNTIVTETDEKVTQMVKEGLAHWFELPNHILIDEESEEDLPAKQDVFSKWKYQWILDPIDGTVPYASGLPFWGVQLAVLEEGKPVLGIIYMPLLNICMWADGEKAWIASAPDSDDKKQLQSLDSICINTDVFGAASSLLKDPVKSSSKQLKVLAAVASFVWVIQGKLVAYAFTNKIWDLAPGWVIGKCVGLDMRAVANGEKVDVIIHEMFDDKWIMKRTHVASTKKNFEKN